MKVSNDRVKAFLEDVRDDLIARPQNPAMAVELQATQLLLDLVQTLSENKLTIKEVTETFRSTRQPLPTQKTLDL